MYHMNNVGKLKRFGELAPEAFKAFAELDALSVKDGAIPGKYKELIAIGVALKTQCPYCIEIHQKNARKAGATEQELAEAAMVAVSLNAGEAITHATHVLE